MFHGDPGWLIGSSILFFTLWFVEDMIALMDECCADWKFRYHFAKDYDVTLLFWSWRDESSINHMPMRHVSLYDTVDTPLHTPAQTQLVKHVPLYNSTQSTQQTGMVCC